MKLIRLKHEMDKEYRIVSLNDAFIEALNMSNGCANEFEEFEDNLLNIIMSFKNQEERKMFLSIIKDEYKVNVLKGWNYKIDNHIWLEKISLLKSSIDEYPLVVEPNFLVKMVTNIHRDKSDLEDGNLLDRIWSYCGYDYVLSEISIDDIEYDMFYADKDLIDEYMNKSLDDIPPIILDMPISDDGQTLDKFPIIDGTHRCAKLKQMGISKIKAYIPMPVSN